MDYNDLIYAAACCDLKACDECPSKGRACCKERTMQELASALKKELSRAEVVEADNERLREAIKPNCLLCDSMHENGNCTETGGFCTAVPAAHCPLIPRLREKLKDTQARAEKTEKERDVLIERLRADHWCDDCKYCTVSQACKNDGECLICKEPCYCEKCVRGSRWVWKGLDE